MGRSVVSLSFGVFSPGWSNLPNIIQLSTSLLGHMLVSCVSVSSPFVKALGGCETDQGLQYDAGEIPIGMDRYNDGCFVILIESSVVVCDESQI